MNVYLESWTRVTLQKALQMVCAAHMLNCLLWLSGSAAQEVVDLVDDEIEHPARPVPNQGNGSAPNSPDVQPDAGPIGNEGSSEQDDEDAKGSGHTRGKSRRASQTGGVSRQKQKAARPWKSRQQAADKSEAAAANGAEQNDDNAQSGNIVQRHSKSGVAVEMEEI